MTTDDKHCFDWMGTTTTGACVTTGVTGRTLVASYPSGDPRVAFRSGVRVERLLLRPQSMLEFMAGLFFVDALVESGQPAPGLILPFVPGARQDRLNSVGDFLFTAKSVAKEINARGFPWVTVLDPHSEVVSALIDRCHVIHAADCLMSGGRPKVGTYIAVVSPDAGAEKRAGIVARKLGLPLLHGWKSRDVATGNIKNFGLEPFEAPGKVLVVDDICDGGGTFEGLGEVIRTRGLQADLYVTHGMYTKGTKLLLQRYDRLICTDSVLLDRDGVEVIPVCDKLLTEGTLT